MAYLIEKTIKSQKEVKEILSLDKELEKKVLKDRQEIIDIIESKDNRKILILGPCSAWPLKAVEEYALRIKEIEKKYSDKIKFILRVYTQKPRTSLGWTGSINQINPFLASNIEEGILKCRELMINILKIGLPIADEALFTHNEGYLDDLLSWIAIGARSSEDQEHRIYASMIEHPVGLKNPSSGNISIAINSVLAAQHSHVFLFSGKQIRTFGNEHAHLVLRGGNGESNIYLENLINAKELLLKSNIKNPSIIIDCSHDNSIDPASGKKDPLKQSEVLLRVLKHMKEDDLSLDKYIKGFMIESFLKTGNQKLDDAKSLDDLDLGGLSISDQCIGMEKTIKLIDDMYKIL